MASPMTDGVDRVLNDYFGALHPLEASHSEVVEALRGYAAHCYVVHRTQLDREMARQAAVEAVSVLRPGMDAARLVSAAWADMRRKAKKYAGGSAEKAEVPVKGGARKHQRGSQYEAS